LPFWKPSPALPDWKNPHPELFNAIRWRTLPLLQQLRQLGDVGGGFARLLQHDKNGL
jgi:hypothetical protein